MIGFGGDGRKTKVARTMLPRTAEFEPYVNALAEEAKAALIDEAYTAFGQAVEAIPDPGRAGVQPDALYETAMAGADLRKRWEAAFGGEDAGRDLFGLVAWTYFFRDKTTWLGTAPETRGLGKRGWNYVAERVAAKSPEAAAAGPHAEPRFAVAQCVHWESMDRYGRVVGGPQVKEGPIPRWEYLVKFRPLLGVPDDERWIVEHDLAEADEASCRGL